MRAELTLGGHYRRSLKAYGGTDVLTMKSVPVPKPGANEVLIRVQASTVSSADRRIRAMDFPSGLRLAGRLAFGLSRLRRPVLGAELTGIVVALGSRTTRFKIGDPVIALSGLRMGGHAEYAAIPERAAIAVRPAPMPIETAAALSFGGTAARSFRCRARLSADEHILVIGAAGPVGSSPRYSTAFSPSKRCPKRMHESIPDTSKAASWS